MDRTPQRFSSDFANDNGFKISHVDTDQNSAGATNYSTNKHCSNDDYFNDEGVFIQVMMIATLAERYGMTEFKHFQKESIQNLLA